MTINTTIDRLDALPRGFRFGAVRCGIKQGRPDLAVIRSDRPASAAGVFTQNPARAPSVQRDAGLVPAADVMGVLVNSGNANAMTGPQGVRDNTTVAEHAAAALGVAPHQVLTMSTGVIGVPLPVERITKAVGRLVEQAGDHPMPFASAILTTDTCTKVASIELTLPGHDGAVRLLGLAKGSGMIHPNMATTLAFVCTDAAIAPAKLQQMLREGIEDTFNAICVDGDTSTNDAVTVLANGASGLHVEGDAAEAAFATALHEVLASLARQVVIDGEGATRLLEVEVCGAPDAKSARAIARTVCRGSLVKCSTFAGEPNWGRIAAAMGQAALELGLAVDPYACTIAAQGIPLYTPEGPCTDIPQAELNRRMRDPVLHWRIDLAEGEARGVALGCDLSYDYVRINADEAPQIEVTDDGVVRRNPGLASYSPRLKHQLLVDGLAYVRRFAGLRLMVRVPALPPGSDAIEKLARDLELCLDATMRPLLVVADEGIAKQVLTMLAGSGHYCAPVQSDPPAINRMLDRGYLSVLVDPQSSPQRTVELAIKLGVHKLIVMGAERGIRDDRGLVSCVSSDELLDGARQGKYTTTDPELMAVAVAAATHGVPALHLVDIRLPHALVGELFTDEGIGTLVTRQAT